MMTPADELEYIIKEIAIYDKIDDTKSYTIKSFPEIFFLKYTFHYTVNILKDYRQNDDVNKRFEEFANEVKNKKIAIENQIVDVNRIIVIRGNTSIPLIPIFYKDCIFTSPDVVTDTCCENCIVEKDETS